MQSHACQPTRPSWQSPKNIGISLGDVKDKKKHAERNMGAVIAFPFENESCLVAWVTNLEQACEW